MDGAAIGGAPACGPPAFGAPPCGNGPCGPPPSGYPPRGLPLSGYPPCGPPACRRRAAPPPGIRRRASAPGIPAWPVLPFGGAPGGKRPGWPGWGPAGLRLAPGWGPPGWGPPGCGRPGWRIRGCRGGISPGRLSSCPNSSSSASTAWPGRIIVLGRVPVVGGIRPGAVAAAVPLVPGRTVRVTAEAGVATFHPIPPGPLCPAGAAGHLPSPLECRSTEIPCMT